MRTNRKELREHLSGKALAQHAQGIRSDPQSHKKPKTFLADVMESMLILEESMPILCMIVLDNHRLSLVAILFRADFCLFEIGSNSAIQGGLELIL